MRRAKFLILFLPLAVSLLSPSFILADSRVLSVTADTYANSATPYVDRNYASVGSITISRPKVLNALNDETVQEIIKAIDELEKDKTIKTVIFTGEGKAFIAGADISQMADMSPLEAKEFSELGHYMLTRLFNPL